MKGRSYTPEGLVLPCKGLAKQTKPGNESSLQPVVVTSFEETILCPVELSLRASHSVQEEGCEQLFFRVVPPHRPIVSSTIARWLKSILEEVGLGEAFLAHSVPQQPCLESLQRRL